MWARLQDKYIMPQQGQQDDSAGGDPGAGGGISNRAAPSSLSSQAAAAPAAAEAPDPAPAHLTGLLGRLLKTMQAGKDRDKQQE